MPETDIQNDFTSPKAWKARLDKCKTLKRELTPDWAESVDFRRGKPFPESSDSDRVAVNLDWSKTKAKHANLFSQVPEVRLTPENPQLTPAVAIFAKALNKSLKKSKVGTAVDEAVIDCINASGVGVVVVNYERRTEPRDVPTVDPATAQQMVAQGLEVPMQRVDWTTDTLFTNRRISPTDFLWPVEFSGSDFDDAPWLGHSGLMPWAEAKLEFNLSDADREKVCGAGEKAHDETLKDDVSERTEDPSMVSYDEIFYWAYRFDPEEKSFKRIKRLVFVNGIEKPVIDDDWAGQKFDEQSGQYVGACKFPIRVLTLTYVSDDCIPPSDSAIGRPQVNELIESRTQMLLQRKRSIPIRGYDVTKIDPEVQIQLQDGTWQGWIPMNGPFQSAIWEVARANYPSEDMAIDRTAKQDLDEVWQTGANQAGAFASGERSASEANIVQRNFQTRIGYERGRVAAFFLGIAEVHAGLLALYGEFETPGWDRSVLNQELVYSILPDSTVLLDANQRIERLMGVLNMLGKSGFINPEPLVKEIAELAGVDPTLVMTKPNPPPTEPLNISIRNAEDLRDPIMLALLMKTGQAPGPQELEAAKRLQLAAEQPVMPEAPVDPNAQMQPTTEPQQSGPPSAPPNTATRLEDMELMPKLNKRSEYQ